MDLEIKDVEVSSALVNEDLPDLPKPFKYRKRADAISICRDYEDKDGKTKSIQRTLCKAKLVTEANADFLRTAVSHACHEIQEKIEKCERE